MIIPRPRAPKGQHHLPRGRTGRAAPLVGLAGRSAVEAIWSAIRSRTAETARDQVRREFHVRNAPRYAEWLGRSRGVLFKAGQILASVLPDPAIEDDLRGLYRAAFARILPSIPPMPPDLVVEAVTAELGRGPDELFVEFDLTPVAAASLGQVHRARMPDGREVAVKVQYPGVEEAVEADLANIELVATFARLLMTMSPALSKLDAAGIAAEIGSRIREELDYALEAAHQHLFSATYAGHPFIHVPDVLPELCTERVLTTEYVDGLPYNAATAADEALRDLWGEAIYRFGMCGMRRLRVVNADPHPGNYVFHRDGRVSFLDFGCIKHLEGHHVRAVTSYLAPAAAGDARSVHRELLAGGFLDPADLPDPEALLAYWTNSFGYQLSAEPFTITPEYASGALAARARASSPHQDVSRKVVWPPDLAMIGRLGVGTLGVLAGLRATAPWRAITDELDQRARPATHYGELDAQFWNER